MKIVPMSSVLRKVDGTELDIVNAARVSFHKESTWEYGDGLGGFSDKPHLPAKDIKLINYLAKHNHWTPFGHVGATFVLKAPIFVARQLGKHQVGFVWNEVSRRYVDEEPEFYFPDKWRGKPVDKKQGSSGVIKVPDTWLSVATETAKNTYESFLHNGVAPEQARMVLPQNTMTEWWWTGSLAAWSRVFKLRLDPHTQQETRDLVQIMHDQLMPAFPNALTALMNT